MKNFKTQFNKILGLMVIFVAVLGFFYFSNSVVGSALQNMTGFAWQAANWDLAYDDDGDGVQDPGEPTMSEPAGMGWLSFNCIDEGSCGNADYGVNIDPTTGYLNGYAWSNYGWVKFGGFATGANNEFPTGNGTTQDNARLVGNSLTGWARFCSVAANPATCVGNAGTNLQNGGWDGWMSLSGLSADGSESYGVTFVPAPGGTGEGTFSGYAWGGNDGGKNVVGWVNFDTRVTGGANSVVKYNPNNIPVLLVTADKTSIPENGSVVINWTGQNLDPERSCDATGGYANWDGTEQVSPTGSFNTGVIPTRGTYVYSLVCYDSDGTPSNTASVSIKVGTDINFYALPAIAYPNTGYVTTLRWSANVSLDSCTADSVGTPTEPLNPSEVPQWTSTTPIPGYVYGGPESTHSVTVPYNPTKFELNCVSGGNVLDPVVLSVPQGVLPESITLSNSSVEDGGPTGRQTTLVWSGVNVNGCVASSNPLVGDWDGNKATSGSQPNVDVPDTEDSTVYTLTCRGNFSKETFSVSLTLNRDSQATTNLVRPKIKEN